MNRRDFVKKSVPVAGMITVGTILPGCDSERKIGPVAPVVKQEISGVWRYTFGKPEKITPYSTKKYSPDTGINHLPGVETCPVQPLGEITSRGVVVYIPLQADELIYGLGLQMQSFQQRGLKKMLRVNADPSLDTGDSHAPVPFYVTTRGYGIFIDSARYITLYTGNRKKKPDAVRREMLEKESEDGWNALNGPYERSGLGADSEVIIEAPRAEGVSIFVFGGPDMIHAIQRYNLFSGGGVLPPRWGLGFWYRVNSDCTQEELMQTAKEFRESNIPCDVLGLEPHWQTQSYSSSYVWSNRFPEPPQMLDELAKNHFKVNMWQQAFVHPKSPIYEDLLPYSGDYEVWDGLVPDFLTKEGRKIFKDYHKKVNVDIGIAGFKADECDNSDFTGFWSFPELSRFPSGADGEQMHCLFGLRYQDTVMDIFEEKKQRTYGLVRNTGAFAAPYPFVLYSDLYVHRVFINTVAQSGFSGLLWTPEVRHAVSNEDLIRRLQTVIFSPLAMVNGWYLKVPPWKQLNRRLNNEGINADDWKNIEALCREIIRLRMRLIPYLHAAFVRYKREGIPPFRALILDYPNDKNLQTLNGQYMMGDLLMVAPLIAGERNKIVYFPEGEWYDFFTHKKYTGNQRITIEADIETIPVFVKSGSLLPLARPTLHTEDEDSFLLTVYSFGKAENAFSLYDDDGSWEPALNEITIKWDGTGETGALMADAPTRYKVEKWIVI